MERPLSSPRLRLESAAQASIAARRSTTDSRPRATEGETDTVAIIDPRHAAKQLIFERVFRAATLAAAILVLVILGGVAVSLLRGSLARARAISALRFVTREIWNPVTDEFGALAAIYGTVVTSVIAMAARRAGGVRHRAVPDGAVSAAAEAADRRRGRTAGRGAEHHFRHLGAVRARARAAASRAAMVDRACGTAAGHRQALPGAALRHRHPHRGIRAGHHGAAVHRGHHARRVRHGARPC